MAKKSPSVVAQPVVQFADVIGSRHLISVSVGPDLHPVLLSLATTPDYRVETWGASSAKRHADQVNRFTIHFQIGQEWKELQLPPTHENYHFLQPLGSDRWLLVRGRADNDQDANAHVFDGAGRRVRSFPAGDGIQDVQTDELERIWISYFDEGVFGNTSLARSGLVCLDDQGRLVFDFQKVPHECVRSMADCYALNVCSGREAWLCYYTDFPLVKLVDLQLADVWLRFPVSGSPAFAVRGNAVLFAGGYKQRNSLFRVDLGSLRSKEFQPVDQQGRAIANFSALGRGSSLFLGTPSSLLKVDVADCE